MMAPRDGIQMERRRFLASMALLGVPLAGVPAFSDAAHTPTPPVGHFPRNDPDRVRSVVGASHGNFDLVQELVSAQPALAKSSWDWGFGDWESALGAASHTGRRQIAQYLIDHGARPTLFSAAMLGQVDTVRSFLTASPELHLLHGPHGISLVRHARAGGAEAEDVLEYVVDQFGPDDAPFGFPGNESVEARYGGRYRFENDPAQEMSVGVRNDWLMVGAGEQPTSRVLEVARDVFHPTGAPAVRLRFVVIRGLAQSMTIEDGPVRLTGTRVGA